MTVPDVFTGNVYGDPTLGDYYSTLGVGDPTPMDSSSHALSTGVTSPAPPWTDSLFNLLGNVVNKVPAIIQGSKSPAVPTALGVQQALAVQQANAAAAQSKTWQTVALVGAAVAVGFVVWHYHVS